MADSVAVNCLVARGLASECVCVDQSYTCISDDGLLVTMRRTSQTDMSQPSNADTESRNEHCRIEFDLGCN